MSDPQVVGLILLGAAALLVLLSWAIIRADDKAEDAYERWYNDPGQIWNQPPRRD